MAELGFLSTLFKLDNKTFEDTSCNVDMLLTFVET